MRKIYSKVNSTVLLHIIVDQNFSEVREEIIPEDNFLQLSTLLLTKNTKFDAHRHLDKEVTFTKFHAQEAWIVLSGSVEVTYFDLDDSEICKHIIKSGEITISLLGGHAYRILDDSRILEFKTGPYLGINLDKIHI